MAVFGLDKLGQRMSYRAAFIQLGVNALIRHLTLEIHKEEVLWTPVWSGQARSNWVVSLGKPVSGLSGGRWWARRSSGRFLGPYVPGVALGRGETANASAAMAQAASVIPGRKPGQTVYIENRAPYIGMLNRGVLSNGKPSRQSPAGFVMIAVHRGLKQMNGRTISFVGP